MRIAIITSHINKSTQWQWFSEDLIHRNIFHLHIIINPTYPQLAEDLKKLNVPCFYFPNRNSFHLILNLVKTMYILIRYRVNIVHCELPYGNLVGLTAAYLCRIRKRITTNENTTWGHDFNNKRQLFIDRLTYALSKKIIALTDLSKDFIHKKFHQPENKILTIWHSLKTSVYLDHNDEKIRLLKAEMEINPDDFVIGMVARFEEWKGHEYVVKAIARLEKQFPKIKLFIFGSKGESYEAVKKLVRELNLENKIFIMNFVNDNITLYKIFDLHIHVPVNQLVETFGITVIEGMISGCPQILTKSGISYYTAKDKKNSLVVDYQSAEQIAEAITWMILHPLERLELGKQAQIDALSQFNYTIKTDKHIQLYAELLQHNPSK
jgi:glycosyltransferase involved in cell wall biosynthesis